MDNRERYNIRVVNLSIGTADVGAKDPLVRAVEAAWDSGICVIIAAGNNGPKHGSVTSPGVSRKVITVGASDDDGSVEIWGDTVRNYSGRGPTLECVHKPDVIAPGANIVSCLTPTPSPDKRGGANGKIVSQHYLRMSGTSMSTPIVSGAVALLLQMRPGLTPDAVKLLLKRSSTDLNLPRNRQGWGLLNIANLLRTEG